MTRSLTAFFTFHDSLCHSDSTTKTLWLHSTFTYFQSCYQHTISVTAVCSTYTINLKPTEELLSSCRWTLMNWMFDHVQNIAG